MDPQAWIALVGVVLLSGTSIVGIAVYSSRTRAMTEAAASDLSKTDHRVRNIDHWRVNLLPADLNHNFARKETVEVELRAIHESVKRIELAIREQRT